MSNSAKILWGIVGAPFLILALALVVGVFAVLLGVLSTIPVLLAWNWGLLTAAPLLGFTAPAALSLVSAFKVSFLVMTLSGIFGGGRAAQAANNANNKAKS